MDKMFPPAPPPQSALARYRLLSPRAGVHVSPIQLGAMSIGDQWTDIGIGSMDKESSFKLLDAFFDNGGNFIDTANSYQDGSSEAFIGEWAEQRGIRDQLFIATKYCNNWRVRGSSLLPTNRPLFIGSNAKSLKMSVEASLKKLRTDYIDVFYVHWWDWDTSIEEVMVSLHNLVVQGKVLYLGISDSPAWVVAKANTYARCNGLTPFIMYQGAWNVMDRAFEREIIPMAQEEGMALAPWNVLAGGKIRTDEEEEKRLASGEHGRKLFGPDSWLRTEEEKKVCKALEKVAEEVGAKSIGAVAIAYVLLKTPHVFPIIGGRKVEHLIANLEALEISLSDEQIKYIESVVPFDPGFPHNMLGSKYDLGLVARGFLAASGTRDNLPKPEPIRPAGKSQ
ncbi:hypothetical protein NLJ89_g11026 [Agrocybe chaxingu]|uniref:NADP-dependent oxidoreductase domain-containing protein n=1 Tax=Agrocybe chaxingu TaxID=84603 RepID=A0A9W8JQ16_9AGAR|nr:hypothetical protein NLJ89_g11026 [Agrocybe chaxingu]